ncbi:MAG: hypothetical protein GEV09_23505 [Pseudonocardiaceae bacterium]|nr:hypothetical protein [Pseudonocardiaceae bacterium]
MTARRKLAVLAKVRGYPDGEHAAAEVLSRPLRDVRKGLSSEDTDRVVKALETRRSTRRSQRRKGKGKRMSKAGSPDRTWALVGVGGAAAAWLVVPGTAAAWAAAAAAALVATVAIWQWAEDLIGRRRR